METRTLLVFKLDGALINTVELYSKKIWNIFSKLELISNADAYEEKLDNLITLNWEKSKKLLAYKICEKINTPERVAELTRELETIESFSLVEEYRLNQALFNIIGKLKNADFSVALHTKRNNSNLLHLSRLVKMNLEIFDHVLTGDHSLGGPNHPLDSLSGWAQHMKFEVIYFGNTEEDGILGGDNVHLVIMPDINQRFEEINYPLVDYLDSVFLKTRQYSPSSAVNVN